MVGPVSGGGRLRARRTAGVDDVAAVPACALAADPSTNLIERTFGESRRRLKVIGRLPGERSCRSLVWAVLDSASRGWRGMDMNPTNVRLLQQLRADLFHPHDAARGEVNDLPETVPAVA